MLSIYCAASMLPCGRYYYDPEGGYVGNPWVKFSYQYAYLYMAWIIHHLDVLEHYAFQYARDYTLRASTLYSKSFWHFRLGSHATLSNLGGSTQNASQTKRSNSYKELSDSWARK
jgi:hypothetical protein